MVPPEVGNQRDKRLGQPPCDLRSCAWLLHPNHHSPVTQWVFSFHLYLTSLIISCFCFLFPMRSNDCLANNKQPGPYFLSLFSLMSWTIDHVAVSSESLSLDHTFGLTARLSISLLYSYCRAAFPDCVPGWLLRHKTPVQPSESSIYKR